VSRSAIRTVSRLAVIAGALAVAVALAPVARGDGPRVVVLPTTGEVDPFMANYIKDAVQRAQGDGTALLVVQLSTPGGRLDSTEEITKALLNATVPTAVWVGPSGGRAASAGTFITLAGALAVMAPGTNIGAASPVDSNGQDIPGTLGQKVKNDAIANISAIAKARGRNVDWAVSTVSDAKSYTAEDALKAGAIDGIAATTDELIAFANGRTVTLPGGRQVVLALTGASVDEQPMSPIQSFFRLLGDPNIAFILFTLGFYGLLFEIYHPNYITGFTGALSIILAFIGFGSLPLNLGGLLLIALGVVLLILEHSVASHGILAIGGGVCFVLGASALYTTPSPGLPAVSVSPWVLLAMVAWSLFFALVVLRAALQIRHQAPLPFGFGGGAGGLLPAGSIGKVQRALEPTGSVHVMGEDWSARSASGTKIERGRAIRVVGQEGLILMVEPLPEPLVGPASEAPTGHA
jgi:membrane-bound serine protease (ClpP class)